MGAEVLLLIAGGALGGGVIWLVMSLRYGGPPRSEREPAIRVEAEAQRARKRAYGGRSADEHDALLHALHFGDGKRRR
jgi:hypothetical protein